MVSPASMGFSGVMAGEMVQFPSGVIGLAFNLEENSVGIIILGDYLTIHEGDEVKALGKLLSVPVGDGVIGRVLDPLGNPLDGKGPVESTEQRPVEVIAAGVAERQPVHEPLQNWYQMYRCDDAHRSWSTRVNHR